MLCLSLAVPAGWGAAAPAAPAAPAEPAITKVSVSGKALLVTASVPRGWQSVTLESRALPDQGAWVPRAVTRAKRLATRVTFRLSSDLSAHTFRVRGEAVSAYPLTFFSGKRAFAGRRSSLWRAGLGEGSAVALAGDGNLAAGAEPPAVEGASRTVEESDIWKLSGDTLYFFNQYRGLQVIDVSDPDAPSVRGTLPLPAVGEQMLLLGDGRHVALLARDGGAYGRSEVLVVDVSGAAPRAVAALPLDGVIAESRLIGSVLVVAAHAAASPEDGDSLAGQSGTAVYAVDLSDPAAPVARSALWFAGQGSAVAATERFVFVATQEGWQGASLVHVIDVGEDGALRELAALAAAGRVADKFKMNLSGDVFTAVSERFAEPEDPALAGEWLTAVETFSLAEPERPAALGRLELAPGERLFATRFDGARAYAVTFRQIDPLWIVDLSDPAKPAVAGAVEVPGWSTYIHPLGDRLVTVGVEEGRVAVSLFDVGDPASAALLSRVPLGEGASWSEAVWNEKALSVFAEQGLLLLPFEGFGADGYASQVQLIDLSASALAARGVINHRCQPRRCALHRGRVLSLSGKELLTVDVADRDRPTVTAATELSWAVSRVFVEGGYVIELETPAPWASDGAARLRVASQSQPDAALCRLELGADPVVGQCVRGGRLYVLQRPAEQPAAGDPPVVSDPPGTADPSGGGGVIALAEGAEAGATRTNLTLTVFDLGALPAIEVAGRCEAAAAGDAASYEAVWPRAELLVWVSRGSAYCIGPLAEAGGAVGGSNPATASGMAKLALGLFWWPWWNAAGAQLLAFDVADAAAPAFVSQCRVNPPEAWGFSAPFAAQGRVYFTHEQSESVRAQTGGRRFASATYEWRVHEALDVVDYADPYAPTERPPIDVPGQLAGLSEDGALLYLVGAASSGSASDREALYACAYDGVDAYQVAALPLPAAWPRPVLVSGGRAFLGRAGAADKGPHLLESWALTASGAFARQAAAELPEPAASLAAFGGLLAAGRGGGAVSLFDASEPAALRPCGEGAPAAGGWLDLSRAAGSLGAGLWVPLDDFGLAHVPAE